METNTEINLKTYPFPNVTGVDLAFSTFKTDEKLLEEARRRGFTNSNNVYNRIFSKLFYSGGKLVFKKDLHPNLKNFAWPYCRSLMGSFEPKHQDKEAVCAMIMSEVLDESTLTV